MRHFFSPLFYLVLSSAVIASSAMGQQINQSPPRPVEATLAAFHVGKNAEGKEVLLPAIQSAPGDTLEYQTVYQNNGKTAIKSLEATLPLPVGTVYVAGSAKPVNPQASLDGKVFSAMPLKTMVKTPDGKLQERLVPYSDYRALRWNLGELAGAEKVTVSARVQINPVSGGPAAAERAK
jgi:uncharacterized repeat protein (TIGR01451 family)